MTGYLAGLYLGSAIYSIGVVFFSVPTAKQENGSWQTQEQLRGPAEAWEAHFLCIKTLVLTKRHPVLNELPFPQYPSFFLNHGVPSNYSNAVTEKFLTCLVWTGGASDVRFAVRGPHMVTVYTVWLLKMGHFTNVSFIIAKSLDCIT